MSWMNRKGWPYQKVKEGKKLTLGRESGGYLRFLALAIFLFSRSCVQSAIYALHNRIVAEPLTDQWRGSCYIHRISVNIVSCFLRS